MTSRLFAGVGWLVLMPVVMTGATVTVLNGDSAGVGFNDPTAVTPVGGNSGTTLGQQRMIAFQAAANKWGGTIASSVTIRVNAIWTALSCTANSAVLGSAGPAEAWHDFAGAPVGGHWYPKALANKLAGFDIDSSTVDIAANFNVNLGQSGCLSGAPFYLGLDGNHGSAIDLVTVVEHELAHGLGFLTLTNGQTGVQMGGLPSIWDDFLLDNSTNKTWTMMTDAERADSAVKTGHLVWNGGNVTTTIPQVLTPQGSTFVGTDPAGRALLYAPSSYQSGSSVSHFDLSMSPDQLMEPILAGDLTHEVTAPKDLTFALLKDIGWTAAGGTAILKIVKSHSSNFTQGQVGATYSLSISNTGSLSTGGQVMVAETPPAGLIITSMSGSNWNCIQPAGPCTRSDSLAPGTSYPSITVTVTVAANASSPLINQASVSGGSAATATTSDSTIISPKSPPTVGPVSPINGSGSSATFGMTLNGGSSPLAYGYVFITNATGTQICQMFYDRASSTIYLRSDTGTYDSSPVLGTSPSGSSVTLSNSECALSTGQSFVSFSGNSATLSLALSFKPAFSGTLSLYLFAANTDGANSGTQLQGTWINAGTAPTVGPVSPINGSASTATFSMTLNGGSSPLSYGYIFITNATGTQICQMLYDRPSSTIYLRSDAGAYDSSPMVGATPSGSSATLGNNECTLSIGQSSVSFSGNSAMLSLALTFKPAFSGTLSFYLWAANTAGTNSGTQYQGTWINAGSPPTVGPMSPVNGSGSSATFSITLNGGGSPLTIGYVFITNVAGTQVCQMYYDRPSSTIFLRSDAGTYNGSALGSSASGSGVSLGNNECTLNVGQSFVSFSGNSATLHLALSFKPTFTGTLSLYLWAANTGGANSGTQFQGTWQN